MSTTSNDEHWLNLITQCRASGLTDRQWCIENGIPVSTFYYHVRALRKKACEVPEAVDAVAQKQEVVQIPLWEMYITVKMYPCFGGTDTVSPGL